MSHEFHRIAVCYYSVLKLRLTVAFAWWLFSRNGHTHRSVRKNDVLCRESLGAHANSELHSFRTNKFVLHAEPAASLMFEWLWTSTSSFECFHSDG